VSEGRWPGAETLKPLRPRNCNNKNNKNKNKNNYYYYLLVAAKVSRDHRQVRRLRIWPVCCFRLSGFSGSLLPSLYH